MAAHVTIVEGTVQSGWNTTDGTVFNGPGGSGVGWGSATPVGDVAVAIITSSKAAAPTTPTGVIGNSLTWTRFAGTNGILDCADSSAPTRRATIWVAPISGASAGTIQATFGATQTACGLSVFYLTGCKITNGGLDAIVQAMIVADDVGGKHLTGRFTTGLTDYDNAVIGCFILDGGETAAKVIQMTGWNIGTQQDITAPAYSTRCVWHAQPDAVWTALDWNIAGGGSGANHHSGGIAIEIANNAPSTSNTNVSHGPIAGLVTSTSVRLTGRLGDTTSPWAGRAGNANFRWGTGPTLVGGDTANVPVKGGPSTDFCITTTLSGLVAGTRYYYQIIGDAGNSTINTFVLPAASPASFKIAYFTDFQNMSAPPSTPLDDTFSLADAKGMDAYAVGGDFDHTNPGVGNDEATSRANTRNMYKRLMGWDGTNTPGMQAWVVNVTRKYPMLSHSWDDHDYQANNSNGTYNWKDSVSKEEVNNFLPLRPLPTAPGGIWQSQRFGTLFSFFNIDGRSQRNPNSDGDTGLHRGDGIATKSMLDGLPGLGATGQLVAFENWLSSEEAAGCIWKIVKMQTPWNHTIVKGTGPAQTYDNWFGYQTEQTDIRSYITNHAIKRVVLLTGDVHQWAFENGHSDPLNLIEIIGGCPNFVNLGGENYANADQPGTWSGGVFPTSAITPPAGNGYTLITLTPTTLTAQAWLHDGTQPLADMVLQASTTGAASNFLHYYT